MRSNQLFALGHGVKTMCNICGKTGVRQRYILRGLGVRLSAGVWDGFWIGGLSGGYPVNPHILPILILTREIDWLACE